MQFTHLLLTRFNVQAGYSDPKAGLDLKWLEYRFQLFEQYCYPSVCAQSNQNFKWLVFFDDQTPEAFKSKITVYARYKNLIPIYVHGYFSESVLRTILSDHIASGSSHLITTRLDNDDAVIRNFIELIQLQFKGQSCEFVNFTQGYCLHNRKLYKREDSSNPFISLIESLDGSAPKSVMCVAHNKLATIGNIHQVTNEPAWLQVIHRGNVSNIVRGTKQPLMLLGSQFVIDLETTMQQTDKLSSFKEEVLYLFRVGRKVFRKLAGIVVRA
jgi:Putative rhamnosyl transferase